MSPNVPSQHGESTEGLSHGPCWRGIGPFLFDTFLPLVWPADREDTVRWPYGQPASPHLSLLLSVLNSQRTSECSGPGERDQMSSVPPLTCEISEPATLKGSIVSPCKECPRCPQRKDFICAGIWRVPDNTGEISRVKHRLLFLLLIR